MKVKKCLMVLTAIFVLIITVGNITANASHRSAIETSLSVGQKYIHGDTTNASGHALTLHKGTRLYNVTKVNNEEYKVHVAHHHGNYEIISGTFKFLHKHKHSSKYLKSHFKRTHRNRLMDKCDYYYHEKKLNQNTLLERIYCNYYPNSRKAFIPKSSIITSTEDLIWTNNKTHISYKYIGHGTWKRITHHYLNYLYRLVSRYKYKLKVKHDKEVVKEDIEAPEEYQEEKEEDKDGDDDGDAEREESKSDREEEFEEQQDAIDGQNNLSRDQAKLSNDEQSLSSTYDY